METTKKFQYQLEQLFPNVDRQKFWDMFVDHEAWSESDLLTGEITIDKPGGDFAQGAGAVRTVTAGSLTIKEDIVDSRPPGYFRYETRNGSLPVNDFGGEFFFEEQEDGLLVKYQGGFNTKYPGTSRLLRYFLRSRQRSVLRSLEEAYGAYISDEHE